MFFFLRSGKWQQKKVLSGREGKEKEEYIRKCPRLVLKFFSPGIATVWSQKERKKREESRKKSRDFHFGFQRNGGENLERREGKTTNGEGRPPPE